MKVEYIAHMGSDLAVVNSARVSFAKESTWLPSGSKTDPDGTNTQMIDGEPKVLSKVDAGLIRFLARGCTSGDWDSLVNEITEKGLDQFYDDYALHSVTKEECKKLDTELRELLKYVKRMPTHWTPFANGGTIQVRVKAPIFVARQLFKHQAGFEPPNEVSRRYVDTPPEFYIPTEFRKAADNVKQGSSDETTEWGIGQYHAVLSKAADLYKDMREMGIAAEQARMVLPQSMYTEWVWKGNLYAWATLYNTRTDSHTQKETRDVAHMIGDIVQPLFPVSWEALTK